MFKNTIAPHLTPFQMGGIVSYVSLNGLWYKYTILYKTPNNIMSKNSQKIQRFVNYMSRINCWEILKRKWFDKRSLQFVVTISVYLKMAKTFTANVKSFVKHEAEKKPHCLQFKCHYLPLLDDLFTVFKFIISQGVLILFNESAPSVETVTEHLLAVPRFFLTCWKGAKGYYSVKAAECHYSGV